MIKPIIENNFSKLKKNHSSVRRHFKRKATGSTLIIVYTIKCCPIFWSVKFICDIDRVYVALCDDRKFPGE